MKALYIYWTLIQWLIGVMTNGGWVFTNNITRVAIWIQFLCEVAANERVDIRPGLHIIDWPSSWSTNTPNFWGFSSRKRWVTGVVKASYLSLFLSPTYQYPSLGHRVNTKSFLLMDSGHIYIKPLGCQGDSVFCLQSHLFPVLKHDEMKSCCITVQSHSHCILFSYLCIYCLLQLRHSSLHTQLTVNTDLIPALGKCREVQG